MPRGDNITQEAAQRRQLQQQLRTQRAQERHTRESRLRDDRSNYLANRRNAITATGGLAAHSRGVRKAEFPSQYREGAGGRMVRQEAAPAFRDATAASAQGLTTNQYVQQRDVMQTNDAARYAIRRTADAPFQAQRQETARSRIAEGGANYRQDVASSVGREGIASQERIANRGFDSSERMQTEATAAAIDIARSSNSTQEAVARMQQELGFSQVDAQHAIAQIQAQSNEAIASTSADVQRDVAGIGLRSVQYQVDNARAAVPERQDIIPNEDGTFFDPNTGANIGERELELNAQARSEQVEREFAQQDRDNRIVDIIQRDPALARNLRDDNPDMTDAELAEAMVKEREFVGGQYNPFNRSFLPGRIARDVLPGQRDSPYRGRLEPGTSFRDR